MAYKQLRTGRYSQLGGVYHITTVTQNRQPFFADLCTGRQVVQELMRLQQQGYAHTLCYVLMPDHLHWLMRLEKSSLSAAVRLLKGRSARAIGQPIWQANFHDHALRSEENLRETARYIVANPLRAGLVTHLNDYSLWDAIWVNGNGDAALLG